MLTYLRYEGTVSYDPSVSGYRAEARQVGQIREATRHVFRGVWLAEMHLTP